MVKLFTNFLDVPHFGSLDHVSSVPSVEKRIDVTGMAMISRDEVLISVISVQ